MRRLAGVVLMLLAACGGSGPTPPAVSPTTETTTAATTAATTSPTTPATSSATTGATSAATTGATSGTGGGNAACDELDQIEAGFTAAIPDYEQIIEIGNHAIEVSGTLPDQGQATLLATIGQDTVDSAQAFLDGDFQKGADLQNRVLQTIPAARIGLGC